MFGLHGHATCSAIGNGCALHGSCLPDVSEHAAVAWCNHSGTKGCKTLDSILCLVAAKVYKKVPNLLLTADSFYLPSVRYINELAAELPLSAHTVVRSLAELHRAHTQIVQSLLKHLLTHGSQWPAQ